MPPRRRKDFSRIRPRWEGRNRSEKRALVHAVKQAFGSFRLSRDWHDLRARIRAAVALFLPANNLNGFFVDQMSDKLENLVVKQTMFATASLAAFDPIVSRFVDEYMGDQVTYYDDDDDDF